MAIWRRMGFSDGAALVVALLSVALGGALFVVSQYEVPAEREVVAETGGADPGAVPRTADTQVEPTTPATEVVAVLDPDPVSEPTPEAEALREPAAPKLDMVRVSPDGGAVIAGSSEPGAKVLFLVNGVELASAVVDDKGSFVGLFDIPASDGPNAIDVARVSDDGSLVSDGTILVAAVAALPGAVTAKTIVPPAAETNMVAGALGPIDIAETPDMADPVEKTLPRPTPAVTAQIDVDALPLPTQDEPIDSPAIVADKIETPPEAPTIVVASAAGVDMVQPAARPQVPNRAGTTNVVIDLISYDNSGEVALEGRGSAGGFVRIYLNDAPVLTSPIGADGSWATPLPGVDAGVYTLRIDEIGTDGEVASRVETPFKRETVALAADALPTAVTVQPGSTLWAIARDTFGEGNDYIRVYEENRDLIRDPDLIYPGQVFALPRN